MMDHYEKDEEHVLLDRYAEEMEDACKYAHLAKEHPEYEKDFLAIGIEEVTHADPLRTLLRPPGHEFSAEHEGKWHRILQ